MSQARASLLQVRGLSVSYPGAHAPLRALSEVDLDLEEHECLGVMGESGSGKTQLLLALLGLCGSAAQVTGSIRYRGEELRGAAPARLAALRGRRIAMVFQEPHSALNPYLSIARQLSEGDRKSTRLNSSHQIISYAVFCLKKKKISKQSTRCMDQPKPESASNHSKH